ncbi:unnamed protein product [Urochloa decumbens]|uniref:CCHC-type domain-containing protein n=1 Tax=Urochloa decumbens TaxID=240449 RepID=A0ABC8XLK2_9POAL
MGSDAHGDRHPAPQIQTKSTTTDSSTTKPTPDPETPKTKLPIHGPLSPSRPLPKEIEEMQVQAQTGPTAGMATEERLTATMEHRQQQAESNLVQVNQAFNVLMPDLAQEIQQQADINSKRGGPELETNGAEEDPLTCDLLQRLNHREVQSNSPRDTTVMSDLNASSTLRTAVMATERRSFSRAEKGKGIAATSTLPHPAQGQRQSPPFKPMAGHSVSGERNLLQGESSRNWQATSTQSPPFNTDSRHWNRELRQHQQNPSARSRSSTAGFKNTTDEYGFQLVKPAYWWRKESLHSRYNSHLHQPDSAEQRRQRYREHTRGKCLNCFSTEHRASDCRSSSKCWRCLRLGHKAHFCPSQLSQFKRAAVEQRPPLHYTEETAAPAQQAVRSASRSYLQAAKGELSGMATYPGDPRARPELAHCAISANGTIKRKREELVGKTVVCWLNGPNCNSHDSQPHHVVDALDTQLHIECHEIKVVKHFPEQYLVIFADSRAYHRVLQSQAVRDRGRVFNFDQWKERRGAAVRQLEFRVRLRIEGVSVHAWSEETVAKIISPNCAIQYIEDPDRDHTAADDVELYHDPPHGLKGALNYKLHIHLDVVEDLSFLGGRGGWEGPGNRKPRREFLWNYGEMDSRGERRSGQSHDDHAGRDYCPRRDRDDHDDNSHGVRRHRSQSSWGRVTRCRGAVEDCYSSSRYRGGNSGYNGHRSRMGAPVNTATWRPKVPTKRVSFANPLTHIMGHPSKERHIREMLHGAHGWDKVHSPVGAGAAVQHLPKPLTDTKMAAIRMVVEQGNKPKNRKRTKITPMPAGEEAALVA